MIANIIIAMAISLGALWSSDEPPDFRKIKSACDFKLLLPDVASTGSWNVEVKWPYPLKFDQPIRNLRLSYFDSEGEYVLGIEQHKARGYIFQKEITEIDIQNRTSRTRKVAERFKASESGERVQIGKYHGYFNVWANREPIPGGILHWTQGNTYVEISSGELTKEQMIEVAESMK